MVRLTAMSPGVSGLAYGVDRRSTIFWLAALAAIDLAACSGRTAGVSQAGGGGAGGRTGFDGGGAGSAGAPTVCPETPPRQGDSCSPSVSPSVNIDAECSWGSDLRPDCRTTATCFSGKWFVSVPSGQTCSEPALPAGCPATPPTNGSACAPPCGPDASWCANPNPIDCWYGLQLCRCTNFLPIGAGMNLDPPQWICPSVTAAGCPSVAPNAGTACSLATGTFCTGTASWGCLGIPQITCESGTWEWLAPASCPVCAAPDTPIATPDGDRPIASFRVGDLVYSVDHDAVVAVPVIRVHRTPVSAHHVMRVVLENGTVLEISPGHPTADDRRFGELRSGTRLDDQHHVVSAELVPYTQDATYDILPASSTGTYFAAGAQIGSTLRSSVAR